MPRYLISFDDGAMDHLGDDLTEVGEAAHAVLRAAKEAKVWVTGGGLHTQQASIVEVDGSVRTGSAFDYGRPRGVNTTMPMVRWATVREVWVVGDLVSRRHQLEGV